MTHTRITQLSYSFSRIHYSLADNLAELVNLIEENLVVRHNSDEEVEEVDRTRMIYAPKGASKLCEFVIIRKVCRYTSFSSRSLSRRSCCVSCRAVWNTRRRERSRVSWIHGRLRSPTLFTPSISLFHRQQRIRFPLRARYAHTHIYMYTAMDNTPV